MTYNWEEIPVPKGSFIGWGQWPGQFVLGKVIAFSLTDGTDLKGNECPELTVELVEGAASFDKHGNRTDYQAGAIVQLTCSLVSLKRAVQTASPVAGDLVKLTLSEYLVGAGKEGGDVKVFEMQIVRGWAPVAKPAGAQFAPPSGNGAPQGPAPSFGAPPAQAQPQQFGAPQGAPQGPAPSFGAPQPQQQFATPGPGQQGGPSYSDDPPPF